MRNRVHSATQSTVVLDVGWTERVCTPISPFPMRRVTGSTWRLFQSELAMQVLKQADRIYQRLILKKPKVMTEPKNATPETIKAAKAATGLAAKQLLEAYLIKHHRLLLIIGRCATG